MSVVASCTPTLETLIARVHAANAAFTGYDKGMLITALETGEALCMAQDIWIKGCRTDGSPARNWTGWLRQTFPAANPTRLKRCMRLAQARVELEAAEIDGHAEAVRWLREGAPTPGDDPLSREVHRRVARQARERAARAALKREEERRMVQRAGGGIAEAYALVRRAAQALDAALTDADDREVKAHISAATRRLHAAEDEIVRASKLS